MSDNNTSNGGSAYSVSYHPRLCHLLKWDDFNGYGFNLHAEKGKAGQYIGKVDEGSPAVAAKLGQGDRIVEVNGVNIGNENHQQVVQRIKAGGEETKLLVVDAETDLYFKEKKIVVRGDMQEVVYCKTPPTSDGVTTEGPVHVNTDHTDDADALNHNEETGEMTQEIKDVVDEDNDTTDAAAVVINGMKEEEIAPIEPAEELKENGISEIAAIESVDKVEEEVTPVPEIIASEPEVADSEIIVEPAAPEPEPEPEPEPPAPMPEVEPAFVAPKSELFQAEATQPPVPELHVETKNDDLLDFGNVSVEEMKKRIQSKKKVDTRFSQMGLREKYDLLQRL